MNSKCFVLLGILSLLTAEALSSHSGRSQDFLDNAGYEHIGGGKYALVVILGGDGEVSWYEASNICQQQGGNLFIVENSGDSEWIGRRINFEKENRPRGPSKFWVGLISKGVNGPLQWIDGSPYVNYPEVVQVSGYDDSTKQFAWAVPDGPVNRLKYEFLTADDLAEAYICQYKQ